MKIRVVSSKEEIYSVKDSEEIVHLSFRPSDKDIFMLVQVCSNLKAIHISNSFKKSISKSIQMFLEMQNIALLEGDIWGHRKDINEYYEIKSQVFDRIAELRTKGASDEKILTRMGVETHLSKDLIKFLM
jgi:hypothetical protein